MKTGINECRAWRTFKCRLNCRWSSEVIFYHYFHLKVSKREIFMTELFTLSDPIRVGVLGTEARHPFFLVMTLSSTKKFQRPLSYRQKIFSVHSAIAKNCLAHYKLQLHDTTTQNRKVCALYVPTWGGIGTNAIYKKPSVMKDFILLSWVNSDMIPAFPKRS